MNRLPQHRNPVRYVEINPERCNGCVLCMKACPTKAIRVREGRATVERECVDCGECVRVCPRGAIRAITTDQGEIEKAKYSAVSASPVLYAQFGEGVTPNDILLGLKKMGFSYVPDQSYTNEMFSVAIELYIMEQRRKGHTLWPLISPVCPVVVRLVACRFPALLDHIPPLTAPREIVAREAKKRLSAKLGCDQSEIKTLYITPCPAKMICIKEPFFLTRSHIDGTARICDIHRSLRKSMEGLEEDEVLHYSGGVGLGWGMSGGEISGMSMNCLAVSGLRETISYLERIEVGNLPNIDYVELRACTEGCLGGLFTVADKYRAKRHLQRLVRMYGVEKRVKYEYAKNLYEEGWFFSEKRNPFQEMTLSQRPLAERIERQKRIEEILRRLPGKECGLCGSPDCLTFAEDVVDGISSPEDCIYSVENKQHKR